MLRTIAARLRPTGLVRAFAGRVWSADNICPHLRDPSLQSPALAINEISKSMVDAGHDVLAVGFGESPFPPPKEMVESLKENAHRFEYYPTQGVLPLREAAVKYFKEKCHLDHFKPDNIHCAPGAKMMIQHVMVALDAEVIVPAPCWVTYRPNSVINQKELQLLQTKRENDWKMLPEELEAACAGEDKPRLLVLNYPQNPTGVTYSRAELEALTAVCRKNGVIVLSDEIYSTFLADGEKHISMGEVYPEGAIILNGLSKSFGAGGWRMGICGVPDELSFIMPILRMLGSNSYSLASAPIQFAAATAFNGSESIDKYLEDCRRILASLGKRCYKILTDGGVLATKPQAAYYMYIDLAPFKEGLAEAGLTTGPDVMMTILEEASVALLSGVAFEQPDHHLTARFCYVDFDGEKALENVPEGEIGDAWLQEYCGRPMEAARRVVEWARKH